LEKAFNYIENKSFSTAFDGLFSEINLNSEKLGRGYTQRNNKLRIIITQIAEGIADFIHPSAYAHLELTSQSHRQNQTRYPIFSFYPYLGLDYQVRQCEKGW
jgi:hypothetical protein